MLVERVNLYRRMRYNFLLMIGLGASCWLGSVRAQQQATLSYRVEFSANTSTGEYAPMWLTANRYGLGSVNPHSAYGRAGMAYEKAFKNDWSIHAGLDLVGAVRHNAHFIIQQAYADVSWRFLTLSIGSKEREALNKYSMLSSGGMVEGMNARPVPQVRISVEDYTSVPGMGGWLSFKGHVAYGRFTDDSFLQEFAGNRQMVYVENTLYHSKRLMLRVGNERKFPLSIELGLHMAAQFGGIHHQFENGKEVLFTMPTGLKNYWNIFCAGTGGTGTPRGDQLNVEGNHVGSWNFALNYQFEFWKVRAYYEHLFEDHSQMFLEYGRWKDGHLGIEITLPQNRWVSTVLWEGLATKDQSGSIFYDGDDRFDPESLGFPGTQISAIDDYYNHSFYQSWHHQGMAIGNPLLVSPIYNSNGSLNFRSNRIKSHHVGFDGNPSDQWYYRVLVSYTRHWGTYNNPFDEVRKLGSAMAEVTFSPKVWKGWHFTGALALDKGSYPGDSLGGLITIKKIGVCGK